jgi:hypothetical protein
MAQGERLQQLNNAAIQQMKSLLASPTIKKPGSQVRSKPSKSPNLRAFLFYQIIMDIANCLFSKFS